ncbi:hypothetical protein LZP85_03950 [Priestia flexa]|jgi:hypothetical protein|uniref:Phosphatidate cytidylyltransferase n=3 Tax=Priestia TaxID=2800373 RepID=A0A0V8JHD8_9BACI|nr:MULTISPECIES: hypothetical protein [Bacillaceae]AQX55583.1 hypothetical protein BC359_15570 [Priestia flexa]KSU86482.1 hypothetical protein AS180_18395 [Priestia veravalensis]KZB91008.1 hypothetical protein A2U94_12480 [Bacillus sp. VT 712]MBN8250862.1 hypothetical protein [Priestia flexa]MBN8433080.1 hypothetical protein [Priestia flexa]
MTEAKKSMFLSIIYAVIILSVYFFNLPLWIALVILAIIIAFELFLAIKKGDKFKMSINAVTLGLIILAAIML